MNYTPHAYQEQAQQFLIDRFATGCTPESPAGAGLFLDPGLGKTSITLSVLELLAALGEAKGALVVAPLRVCRTVWPVEAEKWEFDLTVSVITGTAKQKREALRADADLYVINPESLPWLKKQLDADPNLDPFDTLVVDESTKFKNFTAKRTKSIRSLLPRFARRLILTGTPAPNHLGDLFSQVYLLDNGETLGKTLGWFRKEFMHQGGYQGRVWQFTESREDTLYSRIDPFVLRMAATDHLEMPELVFNTIRVQLPAANLAAYKKLERQLFLELAGGADVVASSAGAKYIMCRGVANGGVYDEDKSPLHVHDAKTDALVDLVDELGGKPVLVAYQFKHDLERIRTKFRKAPVICGGTKEAEMVATIEAWNRGDVPVLLCQPQAMSHGLNLQGGGDDVVWFGLTASLEVYQQLNARLYRQGNDRGQVRIHHLLADETVDPIIYERIQGKAERQQTLLDTLNEYRKRSLGSV